MWVLCFQNKQPNWRVQLVVFWNNVVCRVYQQKTMCAHLSPADSVRTSLFWLLDSQFKDGKGTGSFSFLINCFFFSGWGFLWDVEYFGRDKLNLMSACCVVSVLEIHGYCICIKFKMSCMYICLSLPGGRCGGGRVTYLLWSIRKLL